MGDADVVIYRSTAQAPQGLQNTAPERTSAPGPASPPAGPSFDLDGAMQLQDLYNKHPERIPGVHLLTMNLPRNSKGSFIDRTTDGTEKSGVDQREVMLDKSSMFKISDIRKMKDSDSYELVMDLLTGEEGKKRKKK